ncbi:hypothetical protein HY450_03315, partial [Candidatus Pacearchaeota archaeon]|nr:hypothetical protein [Candidatus Pacearchaeota archaeon]
NFLKKKIKEKEGKLISPEGENIGKHPGAMFFTIGERATEGKGFEIDRKKTGNRRLYVAEKKKNNVLVIAHEGDPSLERKWLYIKNFHIINKKEKLPEMMKARIRHLGELFPGRLKKEKRKLKFIFDKNVEGIAEGQSIVFYKGGRVVGGGEIIL